MKELKIQEILTGLAGIILLPFLAMWCLFVTVMILFGPWGKNGAKAH